MKLEFLARNLGGGVPKNLLFISFLCRTFFFVLLKRLFIQYSSGGPLSLEDPSQALESDKLGFQSCL